MKTEGIRTAPLGMLLLCLFTGGCIVPESTHVEPNFYLLSSVETDYNSTEFKDFPIFYLREVRLPTFLRENRLVAKPSAQRIEFRERHRWGEPLDEGIARVVGQNLGTYLNTLSYSVFPHRMKANCDWELDLVFSNFQLQNKNTVFIQGHCEIRSADGITKIHAFEETRNFTGSSESDEVKALSMSLARLSRNLSDVMR